MGQFSMALELCSAQPYKDDSSGLAEIIEARHIEVRLVLAAGAFAAGHRRRRGRRPFTLAAHAVVLCLLLSGCGRDSSSGSSSRSWSSRFSAAVGWRGPLPSWEGPCDLSTLKPAGILVEQDGLTAVKPGTVSVKCLDGSLTLDVRQPTTLIITQTLTDGGGPHLLDAEASDEQGPLSLGSAEVRWTIGPPLGQMHPCSHGYCVPASSVRVRADAPGTATVRAEAVGLTATTQVVVK